MSETLQKKRIEWVDVLRGMAIIGVLLCHYGTALGTFFLRFCVALFFFVSGMMSLSANRFSATEYIKRQSVRLLMPYAVFAVINTVFYFIFNRHIGIGGMADILVTFALGKRNTLVCAPMWFLPCLFIVCAVYRLIREFLKNDTAVLALCFVISAVAKMFFEEPVMVWSANHAFKYLIYYAIGAAVFPYIKNISIKQIFADKLWKKVAFAVFVVIALWYSYRLYTNNLLIVPTSLAAACLMVFVNAIIMIMLCIAIALLLHWFKPLAIIGQNTMGFCLGESISRALLNTAMAVTGFGFAPDSVLKVIVYNFLAMAVSFVVIIIPLNHLCPQLLGKTKKVRKETVTQ